MTIKLGFELEVGSVLTHPELDISLKKLLTPYQHSKFNYVNDNSIEFEGTNLKTFEIVTAALPHKTAIKLVDKLFDALNELGCQTNYTTGFHINISIGSKTKKINPFALLAHMDEIYCINAWGRQHNEFCRPWEYYFSRLHGQDKNSWLVETSEFESWKFNCHNFMKAVCGFDHQTNNIIAKQYARYREKRISVSIPYAWERGYIEFRTVGGEYLNAKEDALGYIDHFINTMEFAAAPDRTKVDNYMELMYNKLIES